MYFRHVHAAAKMIRIFAALRQFTFCSAENDSNFSPPGGEMLRGIYAFTKCDF